MPLTCAGTAATPSAARRLARADITVTTSAVPNAAATCCNVPSIELPCEYRCGGSAPMPSVNTGVNVAARLTISSACSPSTCQYGIVIETCVNPARASTMPIEPGSTSGRLPNLSNTFPTVGPSSPMTRPPGMSSRPVSSGLSPRRFCRYSGSRIIDPSIARNPMDIRARDRP